MEKQQNKSEEWVEYMASPTASMILMYDQYLSKRHKCEYRNLVPTQRLDYSSVPTELIPKIMTMAAILREPDWREIHEELADVDIATIYFKLRYYLDNGNRLEDDLVFWGATLL